MNLKSSQSAVIGIDVGAQRKGFHAVLLRAGKFELFESKSVKELADWCRDKKPQAIGIDGPCGWADPKHSPSEGSRQAERDLEANGKRLQCFKTPIEDTNDHNVFYDWVRNGMLLYQALAEEFPLYKGVKKKRPMSFETFPHAVACALARAHVPTRPKSRRRRAVLETAGLPHQPAQLRNVDYVDAALCAVTALYFLADRFRSFGNATEGHIIVPDPSPVRP